MVGGILKSGIGGTGSPLNNWHEAAIASSRALAAFRLVIHADLFHLAAQRIAVDAQNLRSLRLIAIMLFEDLPQEALLEFTDRIFIVYSVFDHLVDQSVKLIFQGKTPTAQIL